MRRKLGTIWAGIKIFSDKGCFNMAAAVSFYAFFSLFPLMLLVAVALGFMMGAQSGMLDKVIGMVKESLPYMSDRVIEDLKGLSRTWKTFGWLGIVMLVVSAEMMVNAIADALCAVFDTVDKFGFFRKKIVNVFVVAIAVIGAFLSVTVTTAARIFIKGGFNVYGANLFSYVIRSFMIKHVLPFVIMVVLVTGVYRMFAGKGLNFKYAFYGSLIFVALWEAAKLFFAWYISNFPTYNRVYGSLGTLMVLLIWIFYSVCIFLFCAALAKSAFDRRRG